MRAVAVVGPRGCLLPPATPGKYVDPFCFVAFVGWGDCRRWLAVCTSGFTSFTAGFSGLLRCKRLLHGALQ
ncbi:hypothetical protein PF003_g17748 [Phytophthora fragariae]|nr:hypothetical protein PF003_g17748 [Phytophthora fragariae]